MTLTKFVTGITSLTENSLPPILLHPYCNGRGWLAGLKTAEK